MSRTPFTNRPLARTLGLAACIGAATCIGLFVAAVSIFLRYHPTDVFYASSRRDVPVLLYHGVARNPASEYEIPFEAFSAQMNMLEVGSYHTLSLAEYADHLTGRRPAPERSVFISFHDQSHGWYELAYPLLRELGFRATFFPVLDQTPPEPRGGRTSWKELREMVRVRDPSGTRLFDVAGHGFRHQPLARENGEDEAAYLQRLQHELEGNAEAIEAQLSVRPIAFALPNGEGFDDPFERRSIRSAAEAAGYQLVQAGRYWDADGFWVGGMSIHGTASSMLEFEFALHYASHDRCLRDFALWLATVVERVIWRALH